MTGWPWTYLLLNQWLDDLELTCCWISDWMTLNLPVAESVTVWPWTYLLLNQWLDDLELTCCWISDWMTLFSVVCFSWRSAKTVIWSSSCTSSSVMSGLLAFKSLSCTRCEQWILHCITTFINNVFADKKWAYLFSRHL